MQTETKSIFLLLCLCPPFAFAYICPYGNTSWGDQLTSYNGTAITYDGIGNPLNYYNGFAFTWQGRQMTSATMGGKLHSFTYGENGLR